MFKGLQAGTVATIENDDGSVLFNPLIENFLFIGQFSRTRIDFTDHMSRLQTLLQAAEIHVGQTVESIVL